MVNVERTAPFAQRLALLALAGLVLYLFLIDLSWTYPPDPDSASIMLAAQDVTRGNVTLRGWTLPADPYVSFDLRPFDLPLYAAGVALAGVGPAPLHTVPTVLYVGLILIVGVAVAASPAPATPARRLLGVIAAVIPLALPSHILGYLGLIGSNHISAIAASLAALLALEAAARSDTPVTRHTLTLVALAFVLLTLAVVGDTTALAIAVLPVLLVAAGVLRTAPDERAQMRRRCAAAALVAIAAVGAAALLRRLAVHSGGIDIATVVLQVRPPHFAFALRSLVRGLISLSNGNPAVPAAWTVPPNSSTDIRVVVFGISLYFLWRVPVNWLRGLRVDWLSLVLSVGSVIVLAGYVLWGIGPLRYLIPVAVFASVVMGREIATWAWPRAARSWVVPGLCAAVVCYAVAPVGRLDLGPAPSPAAFVGSWLEKHDLNEGYGDWLDAPVITATTKGSVAVRPVKADGRRLVPMQFIGRPDWYAAPARAHFVVFNRFNVNPGSDDSNVSAAVAAATFGPPDGQAIVGPYLVLIWKAGIGF